MAPTSAPEPGASRRARVGIVAYFFPPLGGVAVARLAGFARHLPDRGWDPVVIAPVGSPYVLRDPAGLESLDPNLEIIRAPSPEPAHLAGMLRRVVTRTTGTPSAGGGAPAADPAPATDPPADPAAATDPAPAAAAPRRDPGVGGGMRLRALPGMLRRGVWFPDDQAGWIPFAAGALLAAHRAAPLDAIVSSSSPISAHVAAMIAARALGVPWVADFRDPWLDNAVEPPVSRMQRWRRVSLEGAIVRLARRCTFATPRLLAAFAQRYPAQAWKFAVVPNGYEPMAPVAPGARTDDHFDLVYAGSLYRPEELDLVLDGIGRFVARRPDLAARLRVRFIGTATSTCQAVADARLQDPALAAVVTFSGFVPRNEALAAVAGADACLTTLRGGPGMDMFVGAKLFDYLAMSRPVFAVIPEGDARDLLVELDWGVVVDPEPDAVATGLARLMELPPPGRLADPDGRYRRSSSVAILAAVLDGATGRAA